MSNTSKNERALQLVGLRNNGKPSQPIDYPIELGYICPLCETNLHTDLDNSDTSLHFSEYTGFMWCEKCDIDMPSCICIRKKWLEPNEMTMRERIERMTSIYLDCVRNAIIHSEEKADDQEYRDVKEATP